MNKKIKVILVLILSIFVLAACSSGGSNPKTSVNESQEAVKTLTDFEKAVSEQNTEAAVDTLSDDGVDISINGKTTSYNKQEFEDLIGTFTDSNFFNVINKEVNKTDTGYSVIGELSGTYAVYSMLGEVKSAEKLRKDILQQSLVAGAYKGDNYNLETPTNWLEYFEKNSEFEVYLASNPDKLGNIISVYYPKLFSTTFDSLNNVTNEMILSLKNMQDSQFSASISDLNYQVEDRKIDNLSAKELTANYNYNYLPTEIVFSFEKMNGHYYISKLSIESSDDRKSINVKEKIYLIKDNFNFYMIDYAVESNTYSTEINDLLLDSFKKIESENSIPEIKITESIDKLAVSLIGEITDNSSTINSFEIRWGDSSSDILTDNFSEINMEHLYTEPGEYTITLVAENVLGEIKTKEIKVNLTVDNNYGNFLDLSTGSGTLNVKADGNQTLAILYPRDDLGEDHNLASFETTKIDSALNNIRKDSNLNKPVRSQSFAGSKYPYDGSEDSYLREMREKTLDNYNQASAIQSLAQTPTQAVLGDVENFTIYNGKIKEYSTIQAKLQGVGDHVLVWSDTSINVPYSNIAKMISEFDNNIYSNVQNYFGEEPQPENFEVLRTAGQKVNIVITPLLTSGGESWAGGYFYSIDLFSKAEYPNSNQRKIIYLHHYGDRNEIDYQIGTIAHEFQHMIFYNQQVLNNNRLDNSTWLNEGFSQLAEDIAGYGYKDGVANELYAFLDNPQDTSLLLWEGQDRDYNMSYLFARYLNDRFGSRIIDGVHSIGGNYKNAVETYTGLSFRRIFRDFAFALWLDDESSDCYGLSSINFPQPLPNQIEAGESWQNQRTRGWGINYTLINHNSSDDFTIDINGAAFAGDYYLDILEEK